MPVISRITAAAIMAIPAKVNTKVPIPPVVGRVKPLLFLTTVVNTPASVVPFVIVVVVVVFPSFVSVLVVDVKLYDVTILTSTGAFNRL